MSVRPIVLGLVAALACANAGATAVPPTVPPTDAAASGPADPAASARPETTDTAPAPPVVGGRETTAAAAEVARARELFGKLEAGEKAFDPAIADLYCDDALIRNTRTRDDGGETVIEIPAPRFKSLLRSAMPLAQQRGDVGEYRDVVAVATAGGVRVTATRHSALRDEPSPYSLLIGDCAGGGYGIREEISRVQP
jgi:hypothetical protein